MHRSAKEGDLEDVRMYLEHFRHDKNPGANVNDCTPMHVAAFFGHLNVVQLIQTAIGVSNPPSAHGYTVLHAAVSGGHLKIVKELIKDLDNKNPGDADGLTVLHAATIQGHLEIVKVIVKDLDNKNPVAKGFFNRTPFHQAAQYGRLEVVMLFCQLIPDITIVDSQYGSNALHLAAEFGQLEVVKFLADIIPINIKDKHGRTACDTAKLKGHQSIVEYLTKKTDSPPPPLPPPIPYLATHPSLESQPCCRALYDFEARSASEFSFQKGDIIMLKSKVNEDWYEGSIPVKSDFRLSKLGYFPSNYVTIITPLGDHL